MIVCLPPSPPPFNDESLRVARAALMLAERQGWDTVTLPDLASASGIDLATLRVMIEDRFDALRLVGRLIDHETLKRLSPPDPAAPIRDRLFDVLMDRFDVMNSMRPGLVAILDGFRREPRDAVLSLPHLGRSMVWMAQAAGLETTGLRGAARLLGLTGLYLTALKVWMNDDTPDMAKTMATLDQYLTRVGAWAGRMGI